MHALRNDLEGSSSRPRRSIRHRFRFPAIAALTASLLLVGCAGGITGLELDNLNTKVCESTNNSNKICGIADDAHTTFILNGQGTCDKIGIKWDDGKEELINGDFNATTSKRYMYINHQYTKLFPPPPEPRVWPGPKTVHAYSAQNCTGEAKARVQVLLKNEDASGNITFSPTFKIGLAQPTATACAVPTNTRPLRAGSIVTVSAIPPGATRINFGCLGCIYDMGGHTDLATAAFPFPGMRRHSLVLRIVSADGQTQLVQGGRQTSFAVSRTGPLELCVNDDNLPDNTGAWGINIAVDETAVP
jgi:hypothetical protein